MFDVHSRGTMFEWQKKSFLFLSHRVWTKWPTAASLVVELQGANVIHTYTLESPSSGLRVLPAGNWHAVITHGGITWYWSTSVLRQLHAAMIPIDLLRTAKVKYIYSREWALCVKPASKALRVFFFFRFELLAEDLSAFWTKPSSVTRLLDTHFGLKGKKQLFKIILFEKSNAWLNIYRPT